ncbi:MAG: UDP-glucose 4-epimerase GalE [Nanoarchaeota archaeon]|nr:UDP-glucose 4-epimerase GalE [Nanoarchaeota archaeon]
MSVEKGTVLVTGGAGYIGSVAVKDLIKEGYKVVVVDNLSKGSIESVDHRANFYEVDIVDKEYLKRVFVWHEDITAVMHFAAHKSVAESQENPEKYKRNVTGTKNLLELMKEYEVNNIIFSSTAAVYGELGLNRAIKEDDPTNPANKYGETKLECEELIKKRGIDHIIFRYFNVVGDGGLGHTEREPENVFPILMEAAIGDRDKFTISGTDYPTKDGTCVRDYIDVNDLVRAHIIGLEALEKGEKKNLILNLGTSSGCSVNEIVNLTKEVTGRTINDVFGKERPGDTAVVTASNDLARKELGWEPKVPLRKSIKSMWEAYKKKKR